MIAGIGVDIVDLETFREQLTDTASTFVEGTFTTSERRAVAQRPSADGVPHLAARFAAKEAFTKAWSSSNAHRPPAIDDVDMRDIEVVNDQWGRPELRLHGAVSEAVRTSRLRTAHLSLSHDGNYAVAMVVLESVSGEESSA